MHLLQMTVTIVVLDLCCVIVIDIDCCMTRWGDLKLYISWRLGRSQLAHLFKLPSTSQKSYTLFLLRDNEKLVLEIGLLVLPVAHYINVYSKPCIAACT